MDVKGTYVKQLLATMDEDCVGFFPSNYFELM